MKKIAVNGVELAVEDRGQGKPIVFLHGFPLNHTMWNAQLDEFARDHRVIAPDLRGFGESSRVKDKTVTMEQLADDLPPLLDALGVREPVVLCVLSMGGYVGWQFLRKHPQRIRGLILCDTRAKGDSEKASKTRKRLALLVTVVGMRPVLGQMMPKLFAAVTREQKPQIVEAVKEMILKSHRRGSAAASRGMANRPDMSSLLPTIRVPTLVIVGEEDGISKPEEMKSIAEQIPGAEFLQVKDAGHMAPMEQAGVVNAAIRELLARIA